MNHGGILVRTVGLKGKGAGEWLVSHEVDLLWEAGICRRNLVCVREGSGGKVGVYWGRSTSRVPLRESGPVSH